MLSGTNGSVDFQNIGFSGTLSPPKVQSLGGFGRLALGVTVVLAARLAAPALRRRRAATSLRRRVRAGRAPLIGHRQNAG